MRISDWSSDVCSSDLEPIHGSAPDIAGQNKANPIATILSVGMMFKYSFDRGDIADRIDAAVKQVLNDGVRTGDIAQAGEAAIGTREMGNAIVAALRSEEHTSELQSLMRISYAVFCLKKKNRRAKNAKCNDQE